MTTEDYDNKVDEIKRDYVREFEEFADRLFEKLADDLEAIDRKHGLEHHDYSVLRRRDVGNLRKL